MILSRFSSLIFITIFVASFSWRPISGIIRRKTKSPLLWSRKPLNVKFGMYLESIANFRETEMSFDVDLYMYLSWRDPFLAHNKSSYILINDHSIRRQIWMPDLYFANARSARFHDVTIPNFSIFIAPDGTVAYSCRLTLTVACNLDLIHYPMDHQKCFIRILSYAYVASEMNVTWFQESPIRYNDEIELPEFIIEKVSNGYCNGTYRYAVMERSYKIGQFSCLEGNIHLRRSIGHNLVQSFIPTGLIVVISWVSFFIDRRAVPARVTLSFTTLLSLATIGNGLRFGLPQVSYAKAIDYWFGACMLFVFCVLLEFAVVNSYMRQSEKYARLARKSALTDSETLVDLDEINSLRLPSKFMKKTQTQLQQCEIPEYTYYDLLIRNILGENLECEQRLDCNAAELQYQKKPQSAMISSVYDNVNNVKCDDVEAIECENGESTKLLTTKYRDEILKKLLSPRGRVSQSSTPPPQWSNKNARAYPYTSEEYAKLAMRFSHRALSIDKICRCVFPALFFLWNLFYWCYYLMLY